MKGRRRRVLLLTASLVAAMLALCFVLAWYSVTDPVLPGRTIAVPLVSLSELERHVRVLSERPVPRDEGHTENLDACAEYIRKELARHGAAVEYQPFSVRGRTYRNVIARFGPATGTRLIVGAHYDAAGPYPGADDNASGVAGLIELARLLGQKAPSYPVELVAYSLEEPPHYATANMGSAVHARSLADDAPSVRGMISLEMIGCFSDEPGSQKYPIKGLSLFHPTRGDYIAVVGRREDGELLRRVKSGLLGARSLPVRSLRAPEGAPGISLSDHRNYWPHGIPAVMITDTAFLRNARYHTAEDTADTLDYRRMARVVEGVYTFIVGDTGS